MNAEPGSTAQDGTQAIRRAAAILERIAVASQGGPPTLSEICTAVKLPRSTTHRILKCLAETGLADYDPGSRRYEVGPLAYELGLAVPARTLDSAPLCSAVDRIAARINVTAYLMRRSGIHAVCIHKAEGKAVIRVIPVEVGHRRVLGVGAGATALLATLDEASVDRVLSGADDAFGSCENLDAETVREAVDHARKSGFATSWGRAYKAVFGLGAAIPTREPPAEFAISIAVYAPDVDEARIARWTAVIAEEIDIVTARQRETAAAVGA